MRYPEGEDEAGADFNRKTLTCSDKLDEEGVQACKTTVAASGWSVKLLKQVRNSAPLAADLITDLKSNHDLSMNAARRF